MRDIAILTFITLDGVMELASMPDKDPPSGAERVSWTAPYWSDVMEQVKAEAMATPYDMLFGRKTYDAFAGHWPNVEDDPIAEMMNVARKYVVTSNPAGLEWNNTQAITGDIAQEISQLKEKDGPILQIHGSRRLIKFLFKHDLIDELRLWTFPVIAGSGKRLFGQGLAYNKLQLMKSVANQNGTIMSIYRRR